MRQGFTTKIAQGARSANTCAALERARYAYEQEQLELFIDSLNLAPFERIMP